MNIVDKSKLSLEITDLISKVPPEKHKKINKDNSNSYLFTTKDAKTVVTAAAR